MDAGTALGVHMMLSARGLGEVATLIADILERDGHSTSGIAEDAVLLDDDWVRDAKDWYNRFCGLWGEEAGERFEKDERWAR